MESLRTLRKRAGWNQKELADRLGVDRTAVVKYESGDSEPSLRTAVRMADLFGVSMDELLGRKPPAPPRPGDGNPLIGAGRGGSAGEGGSPGNGYSAGNIPQVGKGLPGENGLLQGTAASPASRDGSGWPLPGETAPGQELPRSREEPSGAEDPRLLLMLHELRGLAEDERQRVSDFMAGMRAQRELSKIRKG